MASEHNSDIGPEMNLPDGTAVKACSEWEQFIILFASGEDVPAELHCKWIQHAAQCEACFGALARERGLLSLLSEYRSEPDGALLASCRAGLDDAIDRQEE